MENSGDQEILIVSIVDDVALDDERANAVAELWPVCDPCEAVRRASLID
jgi:hypothetical protein